MTSYPAPVPTRGESGGGYKLLAFFLGLAVCVMGFFGLWLALSAPAPAFMHIANGMYGAIIVEPANLPKADVEYVLVSSEWYLNKPGDRGARPRSTSSTPSRPRPTGSHGTATQPSTRRIL